MGKVYSKEYVYNLRLCVRYYRPEEDSLLFSLSNHPFGDTALYACRSSRGPKFFFKNEVYHRRISFALRRSVAATRDL